ncbi:hypothetical protein LCGC14_2312890 [marine sediment metagenome]|uniref:Uncharacterized protein n=1 Tax=marine sediment metagenome TaxID=412755 RepID=A0A0F9CKN0_9ZZZZ
MSKKFTPGKRGKKEVRRPHSKPSGSKEEVAKDPRLDILVPLFVDIIGRLLAAKGMLRYRKDFTERVQEIMEGKDGEKKR